MSREPLRIRQYGCFTIFSKSIAPDEITRMIGIEPDHVGVMGDDSRDPLRPRSHMWELRTQPENLDVNQILNVLITRLNPHRSALKRILDGDTGAEGQIQVVRYFGDDLGEPEIIKTTAEGYTKLPGQHQLLGWTLESSAIAFLAETGIDLDFDEYG